MGLLRFIFIVLLIYFSIKLIVRFVLPMILGFLINRTANNHRTDYRGRRQQNEGKVTIKGKKTNSKFSDDQGEYVDFEEIND